MVYVLIYNWFDHVVICGAYSTKPKAEEARDILVEGKMWKKEHLFIRPTEIDLIYQN